MIFPCRRKPVICNVPAWCGLLPVEPDSKGIAVNRHSNNSPADQMYAAKISRWCALALTCLLAAACAGLPEGVLEPTGKTATGATLLPIMVATTRAPSTTPGVLYGGERGTNIDLTEIVVSIPPDSSRQVGQVQWPKKLPADPAIDFSTVSVTPIKTIDAGQNWLRQHRSTNGRLLIFVHGFNNRYESAVYRFAQIAHDSGASATPVLFTWPSRGSVFAYGYDKESTNYSRTALESLLTAAARDPEIKEVTVLAHSMGTWLTVESLRQMAIRNDGVPSKIQNVILAAPDLDIDVFRVQLADMGPKRPKFTVFVSRDDRALDLSRRISGNVQRLGQIDINSAEYSAALAQEGITLLDLSALQAGDSLNHSKFAESPEVVKLLGDRLIAGQTVTDQQIGVGEKIGAAALSVSNTVGSAAGIAASVPIAIVDPATRRSLGDQGARLGNNLGNAMTGIVPLVPGQPVRRCKTTSTDCLPINAP